MFLCLNGVTTIRPTDILTILKNHPRQFIKTSLFVNQYCTAKEGIYANNNRDVPFHLFIMVVH